MKLSLRCARICVHDEIKKCLTDKPWLFLESSDYSEQVERFFFEKKTRCPQSNFISEDIFGHGSKSENRFRASSSLLLLSMGLVDNAISS